MRLLVDVRPIMQFMAEHYTDERLAMLRAHAEDGRLVFWSCCCFIGIATVDHALQGFTRASEAAHYRAAKRLDGADDAEVAACGLRWHGLEAGDACFRRLLLPLILWEQRRRDRLRAAAESATTAMSCVVKGA